MRVRRVPGLAWSGGMAARVAILALACAAVVGARAPAQEEKGASPAPPKYRMPAILPNEYLLAQRDSIRASVRQLTPRAADRTAVFQGIRGLLAQQRRFLDRVARVYPRDQLEWLLTTDYAADTLAFGLRPLVQAYAAANPQEILTEGRQLLELEAATLPAAPNRMLGFHIYMLGSNIWNTADSLLLGGRTLDRAGVEDGAIRWLQDWLQLFEQAHSDVTERHLSHLKHEDWVIVRLRDNCGNAGADVWSIKTVFMAMIGVDSSRTPPLEQYAHEYHLVANKCPEDERLVYYDLPYLQFALMEEARKAREKEKEAREGGGR